MPQSCISRMYVSMSGEGCKWYTNHSLAIEEQAKNVPLPRSTQKEISAKKLNFREMYQQYASSVICIDSTHKTNVYDFKLVTVMVIDEYGEGM